MYKDYFIRVKQADVPTLFGLAQMLGVLAPQKDMEGEIIPGKFGIHPDRKGAWDVVGTISKPTGNTITIDGPGDTPMEVPEMTPVLDEDNNPYWHANLRIDIDLAERAAELAPTTPQIAAGLSDVGRFFVVDEEGNAARPKQPAQVFL